MTSFYLLHKNQCPEIETDRAGNPSVASDTTGNLSPKKNSLESPAIENPS